MPTMGMPEIMMRAVLKRLGWWRVWYRIDVYDKYPPPHLGLFNRKMYHPPSVFSTCDIIFVVVLLRSVLPSRTATQRLSTRLKRWCLRRWSGTETEVGERL